MRQRDIYGITGILLLNYLTILYFVTRINFQIDKSHADKQIKAAG